jgi:hypothetical protein
MGFHEILFCVDSLKFVDTFQDNNNRYLTLRPSLVFVRISIRSEKRCAQKLWRNAKHILYRVHFFVNLKVYEICLIKRQEFFLLCHLIIRESFD